MYPPILLVFVYKLSQHPPVTYLSKLSEYPPVALSLLRSESKYIGQSFVLCNDLSTLISKNYYTAIHGIKWVFYYTLDL
jgi:hypothetical protein